MGCMAILVETMVVIMISVWFGVLLVLGRRRLMHGSRLVDGGRAAAGVLSEERC